MQDCKMTRAQFIENHANMFWYTPEVKKKDISDSLLVETIMNDGTLNDFRVLCQIMTIKKVADIFFSASGRQKYNYYPEIHNFYSLVLSKYAQRDIVK